MVESPCEVLLSSKEGETGVTRLKHERQRRGMTAWELAWQARVHPADLSKIESGRLRPTAAQAQRIAEALGLPVEELFDHRLWPREAELAEVV